MNNVWVMTKEDCRTDINVWETNLEGKLVIIKPEYFKPEYINAKYQLVKCTGGFGCDPCKMGNAIFVKELVANGESYRMERCEHYFLGIPTDDAVAKWKSMFGGEQ